MVMFILAIKTYPREHMLSKWYKDRDMRKKVKSSALPIIEMLAQGVSETQISAIGVLSAEVA